eukprot:10659887-Ditylum_brightwellii.AAC.1
MRATPKEKRAGQPNDDECVEVNNIGYPLVLAKEENIDSDDNSSEHKFLMEKNSKIKEEES